MTDVTDCNLHVNVNFGRVPDPSLLRIGTVARRCGVSTRTLRYYEEMGLLRPVDTTEGGFRLYDDDVVARVDKIIRLKDVLHFTLDEIRETLEADDQIKARRDEHLSPAERLALVDDYLAALDRQQELVLEKRSVLDRVLDELEDQAKRAEARRLELQLELDAEPSR